MRSIDARLDFSPRMYLRTDQRIGDDLSIALQEQMRVWLKGEATAGNRVFIVAGWPGIGKTWFLQWVDHSGRNIDSMLARMLCKLLAFLRGRSIIYQTLYIDLELQTDTSRFHTPRAFARHHRQRLDEAIQRDVPLCICFDNVPFNGSREMQIIKDEVILRALDHNAFLIFVQQDMRGNGLGGDVPRVMAWQLSPFVDEAVARILQQASDYQVNNDHLQKLVRYAQGHPYLALLMYQSSVDEGIAGFLDYWIQQRNLWNHREQIYTYAHALSLTSPAHIYQMERLLSVCGCAPNQLDEARKLLGPTDLGWWELVSHSEQRYDLYPRWVPVVRAALRYQCEHQKPELYQELSEMTKEA